MEAHLLLGEGLSELEAVAGETPEALPEGAGNVGIWSLAEAVAGGDIEGIPVIVSWALAATEVKSTATSIRATGHDSLRRPVLLP